MKKIKDMTLEEVKNMCKGQEVCVGCVLANEQGSCKLGTDFYPGFPASFDLREPGEPRFSAQDIEDAKALCREFPVGPSACVGRNGAGELYINRGADRTFVNSNLLRGIENDEFYFFREILGREYFEKGENA